MSSLAEVLSRTKGKFSLERGAPDSNWTAVQGSKHSNENSVTMKLLMTVSSNLPFIMKNLSAMLPGHEFNEENFSSVLKNCGVLLSPADVGRIWNHIIGTRNLPATTTHVSIQDLQLCFPGNNDYGSSSSQLGALMRDIPEIPLRKPVTHKLSSLVFTDEVSVDATSTPRVSSVPWSARIYDRQPDSDNVSNVYKRVIRSCNGLTTAQKQKLVSNLYAHSEVLTFGRNDKYDSTQGTRISTPVAYGQKVIDRRGVVASLASSGIHLSTLEGQELSTIAAELCRKVTQGVSGGAVWVSWLCDWLALSNPGIDAASISSLSLADSMPVPVPVPVPRMEIHSSVNTTNSSGMHMILDHSIASSPRYLPSPPPPQSPSNSYSHSHVQPQLQTQFIPASYENSTAYRNSMNEPVHVESSPRGNKNLASFMTGINDYSNMPPAPPTVTSVPAGMSSGFYDSHAVRRHYVDAVGARSTFSLLPADESDMSRPATAPTVNSEHYTHNRRHPLPSEDVNLRTSMGTILAIDANNETSLTTCSASDLRRRDAQTAYRSRRQSLIADLQKLRVPIALLFRRLAGINRGRTSVDDASNNITCAVLAEALRQPPIQMDMSKEDAWEVVCEMAGLEPHTDPRTARILYTDVIRFLDEESQRDHVLPQGEREDSEGHYNSHGEYELDVSVGTAITLPVYKVSQLRNSIRHKLFESKDICGDRIKLIALTAQLRVRLKNQFSKGLAGYSWDHSLEYCSISELIRLLQTVDLYLSVEEGKYVCIATFEGSVKSKGEHSAEQGAQLSKVILFFADLLS